MESVRSPGEWRQQRFRSFGLLMAILLGLAALAAGVGETYEVIELVPLENLVLASPTANPHGSADRIGTLKRGQTVEVLSCSARKNQTDVEVRFNETTATVWKGAYRLARRPASGPDPHATATCAGVASS